MGITIDNIGTGVAAICAIIAIIAALYDRKINKRKLQLSITSDRLQLRTDARKTCYEYMCEYLKESPNTYILKSLETKITLYFVACDDLYYNLSHQLHKCSSSKFNYNDYYKLLKCMRALLDHLWISTKEEAGIKQKSDSKRRRKVEERINKGRAIQNNGFSCFECDNFKKSDKDDLWGQCTFNDKHEEKMSTMEGCLHWTEKEKSD